MFFNVTLLRHYVTIYRRILYVLRILRRNSLPWLASKPGRKKGNNKHLFFLEWESNTQPVAFTVILCAPAPRLA